MKKALIICCYFGKLPSWTNVWIKSCGNNPDFNFMLVTDSQEKFQLPSNVEVLYQTFDEIKDRIQSCLEIKIQLEIPYKLCDYRPVYGLAFSEYLKEYEFWGHCDLDMLFGCISHFFTDEMLNKYDRLGTFGHLILYRNNETMNNLFRQRGAVFSYKKIFTEKECIGLDEMYGVNLICRKNKVKWLNCGHEICLDRRVGKFLYFSGIKNYFGQRVFFNDGKIYQVYLDNKQQLQKKEKMYFHFSSTNYLISSECKSLIIDSDKVDVVEDDKLYCFLSKIFSSENDFAKYKGHNKWEKVKNISMKNYYQKYIFVRKRVVTFFSMIAYRK